MQTRRIGTLDVSIVGLGCNNFGSRLPGYEESARVIHAALDAGINFFDTADIYGGTKSEEYLGRALKDRRGEAIIATKFGNKIDDERKGAHPDYVKRAAEDSLRRLGVETIVGASILSQRALYFALLGSRRHDRRQRLRLRTDDRRRRSRRRWRRSRGLQRGGRIDRPQRDR